MQDRTILHCDLNNFFASVEIVKNPDLAGKAIAVCGDPEKRHGIVLAKSELAKKCGVTTGMVIWKAKQLCPSLETISTNHADYGRYSKMVQQIYYRYTDLVESFGIDECWLDVTKSLKLFKKTGEQIADEIREVIKSELGLTVSIGVSWNKTFAKLGSDLKKPDATTVISRENYMRIVFSLPVNDLLYIGRKTTRLLERMNVKTIGDLAACDSNLLSARIGINAHRIITMARGEETDEVRSFDYQRIVKSVGNGTTLPHNVSTIREIEQVIYLLSEEVAYRLRKKGLRGTTINLSLRSPDLEWTGAQMSIQNPTNFCKTICEGAYKILKKIWIAGTPLMGMRVAVSNLTTDKHVQLDLFSSCENEARNDKLSAVFDIIRRKHGTKSVSFAQAKGSEYTLHFDVIDE